MRRAALAAAMALVALVVAPQASRAKEVAPLAAAQALLDERARAILNHDRAAFLATIDPDAPASFRDAQARSYDGWVQMPLATYRLVARVDETGDLAAGASGRHGAAPIFLPETRQHHRLRGYDDRDAVDSLWLSFVERGGRWYVASDTDLEDLGLDTTRALWELGDVRLQPTPHFLVISHRAQAERAEALAGIAEDAAASLEHSWDLAWSGKIPLVVPGSVDELEVMLQSTVDLDKFVAFVSYGATRDEGHYTPTAPRGFVQDRNLSRYPRSYQVETLLHELTHGAAVPYAGPFVPNWVHEGIAEWVSRGRSTARAAVPRLPRDHQFVTGSSREIVGAYDASRLAVTALARAKGTGAPTALLRDLGSVLVAAGNQDFQVDAALHRVAGIGTGDLERAG